MIIKSNMTPAETMAFCARLFQVARVASHEARFAVSVTETAGRVPEITSALVDDCASVATLNFGAFGEKSPAVEVVATDAEPQHYLPPYRVSVANVEHATGISALDHAAINHAHLEPVSRADCAGIEVPA